MAPKLTHQLAQRVVVGPESTKAGDKVRIMQANRQEWPYWWSFPPRNARRVNVSATLDASTLVAGTQAEILAYPVPSGFTFVWTHLVQAFQGQSFGLGDITWTIDRNTPIGTPITQSSF